ncbi:cytochrome c biogenesis CcdA family protein [Phycicoccus sp. Root101]|uniref:cytochrome c biogenesis CcdA family protein n=1 Tax=Phycicoccus sp. Root101 TaxID=1736421 RepID=UPI0009E9E722|nr:cytochrome c biogenesis protein CcdA [Phycicoccus sp. Root101]
MPAAIAISGLAGLIAFASPCMLPLVPGILAHLTDANSTSRPAIRRRTAVIGAALFTVGFSAVYIAGAVLFSSVGALLLEHRSVLLRTGGVMVIVLALVFLGVGPQTGWRPRWKPRPGLASSPLLGLVFGLGWAPCSGPTLGAVMALATATADTAATSRGVILAIAYCAGLGLPLLALAAGATGANRLATALRRRRLAMHRIGGVVLLVTGMLMATGLWDTLVATLQTRLVSSFTTAL